MTDIRDKEDVKVFIDAFYEKVRLDQKLGPVFISRIPDDAWPSHLERMYSFWNTVLFGEADYRGNPFSKHASLRIHEEHFNKWIALLGKTIDEHFHGKKADEVKARAQKMGDMFQAKLKHIRSNNNFKNII